jgi:hypothetical protein
LHPTCAVDSRSRITLVQGASAQSHQKKMKNGLLLFLTLFSLILSACSEKGRLEPVVVHVFRDGAAGEINSALLALGAKQLRTSDGRPIMIATTEVKNYADGLEILGRQDHPDLIILNSADDAPVDQRNSLVPVESATRKYFASVPTWSEVEEQTAAKVVLSTMQAYLAAKD